MPNKKYATVEDLQRLEGLIGDVVSLVKDIKQPSTPPIPETQVMEDLKKEGVDDGVSTQAFVSPDWRKAVDEIVSPKIGMTIKWIKNGPQLLTLSVPREMSNASDEHWKMYKSDLRSLAVDPSKGLEGIKSYLEKVKRNLQAKPRVL